ncbi:hypothetical protein G7Z17_g101 [Cylindrodendrum hubeiense]|uniref:Uncharacterized protein n=1 Tax=Cylindrodendrum hubeiense TaxID=595255 RepID=A0A9P5HLN5_9HYPO|nr:hypothetical protein G7Z17_g101 [Cylindrodendrum hubeiense]
MPRIHSLTNQNLNTMNGQGFDLKGALKRALGGGLSGAAAMVLQVLLLMYNLLTEIIAEPPKHPLAVWLLRLAFIGLCASVVSDTISNSLRVVKTYRQVNETKVSYTEAANSIIREDGIRGLFGRGLKTRILANGLQGLMFSILWKLFLDLWEKKTNSSN